MKKRVLSLFLTFIITIQSVPSVYAADIQPEEVAPYIDELINFINENYIGEVDQKKLIEAAMHGIAETLDDYSEYYTEAEYSENPGFTPNANYVEILDIVKAVSDAVDIQNAKILVSGGRGVGSAENFAILEDLAKAIGGEVSCSRAVVDSGWKPKELQVGQTGKTVRPHVYFAIGISGAIQHVAGMEESDIIIAINKDETAPIFDVADYGVVGDLNKIVPELTKKILAAKEAKENN
jgi:electron transfer flavoprotein alpha subunit